MGRSGLTFGHSRLRPLPNSILVAADAVPAGVGENLTRSRPILVVRPARRESISPRQTMARARERCETAVARSSFHFTGTAFFGHPAQALRTVPTLTGAQTSAPRPRFCAPARPCGGRWIGSKYAMLAQIRLLIAPGDEAPRENCGLAGSLGLNRKVQSFPIVNATTSGGGVQMWFAENLGGSPDDTLREIAATAQNTHPMAGS
jgi:hypothetical protein